MQRSQIIFSFLLLAGILSLADTAHASVPSGQHHSFVVEHEQFMLDGRPFRIIAGEMDYPRVPREYWRDRFRKMKAMGLNTVTTYVFWNLHEPRPGVYDFSGNKDVAEYIREAQQEGLYVILRPGPYICTEWDLGGLPSWLLKDHATVVRSTDPKFMVPVARWMKRLAQELAPLQIENGGPILMVQIENEYGSFGSDHAYMKQIYDLVLSSGFNKALPYTADGPEEVPNGALPGVQVGLNFGIGDAQKGFQMLKDLHRPGPYFNSEYWAGWFDFWGENFYTKDSNKQAADIDWILRQGYSISIYVFHGGTSLGFMNGANDNGPGYRPFITSYDYDAALDESGRPTPKYFLFREIIAKATGVTPPPVPTSSDPISIPSFPLAPAASLWQILPTPVLSNQPLSMEDVDQSYGYILYRTRVTGPVAGDLILHDVHDYAQVYLDGKLVGTLDRRLHQNKIHLDVEGPDQQLDILVENTGRVNFGVDLRYERKGITRNVTLAGLALEHWQIFSLPMNEIGSIPFNETACNGPCFYHGTFGVDHPGDTFLDMSGFGKGMLWLNGRPMGRFWDIGPQKTLYIPGPWLKKGENEVIVFDMKTPSHAGISGRTTPILDSPISPRR